MNEKLPPFSLVSTQTHSARFKVELGSGPRAQGWDSGAGMWPAGGGGLGQVEPERPCDLLGATQRVSARGHGNGCSFRGEALLCGAWCPPRGLEAQPGTWEEPPLLVLALHCLPSLARLPPSPEMAPHPIPQTSVVCPLPLFPFTSPLQSRARLLPPSDSLPSQLPADAPASTRTLST